MSYNAAIFRACSVVTVQTAAERRSASSSTDRRRALGVGIGGVLRARVEGADVVVVVIRIGGQGQPDRGEGGSGVEMVAEAVRPLAAFGLAPFVPRLAGQTVEAGGEAGAGGEM